MSEVILITGAGSGFGELAARAFATAGHTVYASMRDIKGADADKAMEYRQFSQEKNVQLLPIELDVQSQNSADNALKMIIADQGRIDVLIHNAGHMTFGPLEAFTPEQIAALYDINVVSTQRVNRVALPYMRKQKSGLVIWNSSSSAAGGTPPYLGPYFAAKAGMDALAVAYSRELIRWGIETSIVVPGAFTKGTNHFANAGAPDDKAREAEYEAGPYKNFGDTVKKAFAGIVPEDADVSKVAEAMVRIVETPRGKRPYRVGIDFTNDGSMVVNPMLDRVREEMLYRVGLSDLLKLPEEFTKA
jgi:NAD(P)-dependent dehydrogenase (short-subunit alcohol dehydrogenase family)